MSVIRRKPSKFGALSWLCFFHEISVKLDCSKDFNVEKVQAWFFCFLSFLFGHSSACLKKKICFCFFNDQGTIANVYSFTCMLNVC